jgi:hypothetical protein
MGVVLPIDKFDLNNSMEWERGKKPRASIAFRLVAGGIAGAQRRRVVV